MTNVDFLPEFGVGWAAVGMVCNMMGTKEVGTAMTKICILIVNDSRAQHGHN